MDRVLIFRGGALGDFLLTVPILAAIRSQHPQSHITLVTRPDYGSLLRQQGLIDEFQSMDSADLAALFSGVEAPSCDLRKWVAGYQNILAWQTDQDGLFSANLRSISTGDFRLLDPVVRPDRGHALNQLANGLPVDCEFSFAPSSHGGDVSLAIHVGSGSRAKNWPVHGWESLLRIIASDHPDLPLFVITGEADARERAALDSVLKSMPNPITEAAHWPLVELAPRLFQSTAYLGHDTGISHLAALCGVPSLWLFGPTDPLVWAPRSSHVQTFRTDLESLSARVVWEKLRPLLTPISRQSGP